MKTTCCPQYVIRMDSTKFRLSRSQRRTIKKFKQYIVDGKRKKEASCSTEMIDGSSKSILLSDSQSEESSVDGKSSTERKNSSSVDPPTTMDLEQEASAASYRAQPKKPVKPGVGPDPSKPLCLKAKVRRREQRAKRQASNQQLQHQQAPKENQQEKEITNTSSVESESSKTGGAECTLSTQESHQNPPVIPPLFEQDLMELLTLPSSETGTAHRFETRLILTNPRDPNFNETYEESYEVFKKFQMVIHKESEEDCTRRHFEEFLVESPLLHEKGSEGMPCDYGTYHQQYLLDGKIIAVGVLDIIPKGVLCEYLYYDPEYRFLAPGVYTAIQETALTQQVYRHNPQMQYYYMGFYVQSCPKMNYKSKYGASYLLCPETYTYVPLQQCIPKLLESEYSRLADSDVPSAKEGCTDEELNRLPLFSDMTAMTYGTYALLNGNGQKALVEDYVLLVSLEVATRLTLYTRRRS